MIIKSSNCYYSPAPPSSPQLSSNDTQIYIAAGHLSNDDTSNQLNYTIVDTFIHPEFYNVERHDLALIKVAERLPATGIIALSTVQDSSNNCSLVVRNNDLASSDYFKLVTNIRLAPDNYCSSVIGATAVDDDDYYCSQYPMGEKWCDITIDQVRNSDDLGSALICNNVFMGVLSDIQFPYDQITFPCNVPRMTFGLYTSLDKHRDWMYQVMGRQPLIPTDPDDAFDEDKDNSAVIVRQATGILMITAAVFVYYFL